MSNQCSIAGRRRLTLERAASVVSFLRLRTSDLSTPHDSNREGFGVNNVDRAREALQKHFGFTDFLEGQAEVIEAVLAGENAVVVMPTGGGKSLCYQLPAMMIDGVTLV